MTNTKDQAMSPRMPVPQSKSRFIARHCETFIFVNDSPRQGNHICAIKNSNVMQKYALKNGASLPFVA
jgi:hypothetical protein